MSLRLDIVVTARLVTAIDGSPSLYAAKRRFFGRDAVTPEKCEQFAAWACPGALMRPVRWDLIALAWERDVV